MVVLRSMSIICLYFPGLDPAQPCFWTTDSTERLDPQDADFVDIIHTNGRLLSRIGFGFPDPNGKRTNIHFTAYNKLVYLTDSLDYDKRYLPTSIRHYSIFT